MQMNKRGSQLLTIGTTAVVTAAVTTFARNFISGEKKIKHRIAQRYGISDPQFERSMSQLMGPPILEGNVVTPLHNGVEIFPAMLKAIERSRAKHHFRDLHIHQRRNRAEIRGCALGKSAAGSESACAGRWSGLQLRDRSGDSTNGVMRVRRWKSIT